MFRSVCWHCSIRLIAFMPVGVVLLLIKISKNSFATRRVLITRKEDRFILLSSLLPDPHPCAQL